MNIAKGLKSNDEEIIALYSDIAIEKYTVNQVNEMLNKRYFIHVNDGYFYLYRGKSWHVKKENKVAKLNFTFKKNKNEQREATSERDF